MALSQPLKTLRQTNRGDTYRKFPPFSCPLLQTFSRIRTILIDPPIQTSLDAIRNRKFRNFSQNWTCKRKSEISKISQYINPNMYKTVDRSGPNILGRKAHLSGLFGKFSWRKNYANIKRKKKRKSESGAVERSEWYIRYSSSSSSSDLLFDVSC